MPAHIAGQLFLASSIRDAKGNVKKNAALDRSEGGVYELWGDEELLLRRTILAEAEKGQTGSHQHK